MAKSQAVVATEHGSRYLQQLCKHWGHRFTVEFTPERGHIDFGDGTVVDLAATPTELTVDLDSTGDIARMEQVVADHILRFAFRENLAFDWKAAA